MLSPLPRLVKEQHPVGYRREPLPGDENAPASRPVLLAGVDDDALQSEDRASGR